MKCFHCSNCGMMVFFENEFCVKCGESLGFFPDTLEMSAQSQWDKHAATGGVTYRLCANKDQYHVCNWLVSDEDHNSFCLACRLNDLIPDLTVPGNRDRWYKLELAKRRCLCTFLELGLPIETSNAAGHVPLRFRFLSDSPNQPLLTGHENGIITINIAEADEDERERRRLKLHEPYRTLVGHFRHESGHYYWDRLIAGSDYLPKFRELFGDETVDYNTALQKYYQNGPAPDWAGRTVTAYASLHPWEDWAETWAHYLHMIDTLETAANFGLGLKPLKSTEVPAKQSSPARTGTDAEFDQIFENWLPLTAALNSINRGMGVADLYPFIIPEPAMEKLRFIHMIIKNEGHKPILEDTQPQPKTELGKQLQAT